MLFSKCGNKVSIIFFGVLLEHFPKLWFYYSQFLFKIHTLCKKYFLLFLNLLNYFLVAIDLIVQHIREFLNNRQKNESSRIETETSNHQLARRVNSGESNLKRPH